MIDDENAKRSKKQDQGKMTTKQIQLMIKNLTSEMNRTAKALDFEEAAQLRDQILELKAQL
jgi:excinuclease ABC subunit B